MERSEPRGALRYGSICYSLFRSVLCLQQFLWTGSAWLSRPQRLVHRHASPNFHAGRSDLQHATQVPRFVQNPEANWGPKHRHKPMQVSHPSITLLEKPMLSARHALPVAGLSRCAYCTAFLGHLPQPDGLECAESLSLMQWGSSAANGEAPASSAAPEQGAADEPAADSEGVDDTAAAPAAAPTGNGMPGSVHDDKEPGAKKRKAEHNADVGQEHEQSTREATNVL